MCSCLRKFSMLSCVTLAENYAVRSVNSKVSTINALLESMGCREFQVTKQLPAEEFDAPELTRQEYVRMLQTAKRCV